VIYVNSFRISIAIEDVATGGMRLLVVHEIPFAHYEDPETDGQPEWLPPGDESRGSTIEGTLLCSIRTWLRIKSESIKQGAHWNSAISVRKERYWSSKPMITVLDLQHNGMCHGIDESRIWVHEVKNGIHRVDGTIDELLVRVSVRGRRTNSIAIEGL
jgi:hypothetical protein